MCPSFSYKCKVLEVNITLEEIWKAGLRVRQSLGRALQALLALALRLGMGARNFDVMKGKGFRRTGQLQIQIS